MGSTSAGTFIASGAVINLNGQSFVDLEPLTISGTGLTGAPVGVITNSSTTAAVFGGPITLASNSSIGGPNQITLTGAIGDDGGGFALTKVGAGVLILTGNETYSGGTTISAGTLQIGVGGTSGNITGNIIDNGSLIFDRSDNLTYTGVLSGSGTLTQNGGGSLTLTAAGNTDSGLASVNAGSLVLAQGANWTGTGPAIAFGNVTTASNGSFVVNAAAAGGAQAMGALTTSGAGGDETVQSNYGGGGTAKLTFASLSARARGTTLNFVSNGGVNGVSNIISFTTAPATGFISQGHILQRK